MKRESFIFYTSWLNGISGFTEEEQGAVCLALLRYCACGEEPKDVSPVVKMAFTYAKPQIDANNAKYSVGHNGGSKNGKSNNPNGRRGKQETNKELTCNYLKTNLELTSNYQETIKKLPNVNVNDNDNDNVYVSKEKIYKKESEDSESLSDKHARTLTWMEAHIPHFYSSCEHVINEKEMDKLVDTYGKEKVFDVLLQIENRKDKRRTYANMYLTTLNWLKKRFLPHDTN